MSMDSKSRSSASVVEFLALADLDNGNRYNLIQLLRGSQAIFTNMAADHMITELSSGEKVKSFIEKLTVILWKK